MHLNEIEWIVDGKKKTLKKRRIKDESIEDIGCLSLTIFLSNGLSILCFYFHYLSLSKVIYQKGKKEEEDWRGNDALSILSYFLSKTKTDTTHREKDGKKMRH